MSVVPLVLRLLASQRNLHLPYSNVLVSSPVPQSSLEWLTRPPRRGVISRSPLRGEPQWMRANLDKKVYVRQLLASVPDTRAKMSRECNIVLLQKPGTFLRQPSSSSCVTTLPISLSDVAAWVRARHAPRRVTSNPALPLTSANHLALEGEGSLLCGMEEDAGCLLPMHSKDLMVAEIDEEGSVSNHCAADALLVGAHLLQADGTFVLIAPSSSLSLGPKTQRYLEWRFSKVHFGRTQDGSATFLCCMSGATEHPTSYIRKDDFPGFLSKGMRRERQWNPYRRAEVRRYPASLRPSFTNAPLIKDQLQADLDAKCKEDEATSQRESAFFDLAHDMVSELQYAKRDD